MCSTVPCRVVGTSQTSTSGAFGHQFEFDLRDIHAASPFSLLDFKRMFNSLFSSCINLAGFFGFATSATGFTYSEIRRGSNSVADQACVCAQTLRAPFFRNRG